MIKAGKRAMMAILGNADEELMTPFTGAEALDH